MSYRVIKDSIWTSPNLNKCSVYAERHCWRILPGADDWGCIEITPLVLRGRVYPLKTEITPEEIDLWNKELIENDILRTWIDGGRLYAQFITFDEHNTLRDYHAPKTPCPPWIKERDGVDPRLSDKTTKAFAKIEKAIQQLSNNGSKPTMRKIAAMAHSGLGTVEKYVKRYGLTNVTDVTDE